MILQSNFGALVDFPIESPLDFCDWMRGQQYERMDGSSDHRQEKIDKFNKITIKNQ